MNHTLKIAGLLGVAAFLLVGCNGLNISDGSGNDGGTDGSCLASSSTDGSTKLALNTAVSVPAGSGSSSQVAEVFVINGESRALSKVTLLLDQVAPYNTYLSGQIQVGIYSDELVATNGAHASPSQPVSAPYVDPSTGVAAISTSVNASNIGANRGAQWIDFCFDGASGDGCTGNRGQVTLSAGQIYWIVISGAPVGGTSAYIDWYGSNNAAPYSAGEIGMNNTSFVPVNNPSTNFNFAFKLGC